MGDRLGQLARLGVCAALALASVTCTRHHGPCLLSQQENRHRDAWTQTELISVKPPMFLPVNHPARDWVETVCDRWEDPDGKLTWDTELLLFLAPFLLPLSLMFFALWTRRHPHEAPVR